MKLLDLHEAIALNTFVNIHSLILYKDENLIFENYYNDFQKDTLHDIRSSFKAITSLLLGIAIDQGFIRSTDELIYKYFGDFTISKKWDSRKKLITIEHLLKMTSGLDCEEFFQSKDCESEMEESSNWIKFCLELPMINPPGSKWSYTTINTMLVGAIISRAAKMSVMEFAKIYLFDPLAITDYKWTLDPQGEGMAGGSFYMRPLDMVKIGQMVLNDGIYKNRLIISKNYVHRATAKLTEIPGFSFIQQSRYPLAKPDKCYFGYSWYHENVIKGKLNTDLIFSSGNGGQYIVIIKKLNMVIVCTQGNYDSWKAKQFFELLIKYILPE